MPERTEYRVVGRLNGRSAVSHMAGPFRERSAAEREAENPIDFNNVWFDLRVQKRTVTPWKDVEQGEEGR